MQVSLSIHLYSSQTSSETCSGCLLIQKLTTRQSRECVWVNKLSHKQGIYIMSSIHTHICTHSLTHSLRNHCSRRDRDLWASKESSIFWNGRISVLRNSEQLWLPTQDQDSQQAVVDGAEGFMSPHSWLRNFRQSMTSWRETVSFL